MTNILLCGVAGSGKTTVAKELEKTGYHIYSFAEPVKRIAAEILLRPVNKLDPLDRKFLQELGTNLARARDECIWIKHMEQRLRPTMMSKVVIDDARFLNEAKWAKDNGFMVVKLEGRRYNLAGYVANHKSETELEQIKPDFYLDNSGTIEDTMELLKGYMIAWIRGKQ